MLCSKKSKVKKKGGDGASVALDPAELPGQSMAGSYYPIFNNYVCSLSMTIYVYMCVCFASSTVTRVINWYL